LERSRDLELLALVEVEREEGREKRTQDQVEPCLPESAKSLIYHLIARTAKAKENEGEEL